MGDKKSILIKSIYFLPLFVFGLMHFTHASYFLFMVPDVIPGAYFWVYFSGAALCAASLAITMNFFPRLASICLILFVITFIVAVDIPGIINDPDPYRYVISLLKDISLGAGTYIIYRRLL